MKKLLLFTLLLSAALFTNKTFAQSEERRNKIQLVVNYGGKAITTELNSLNTSLSRNVDDEVAPPVAGKDTSKTKLPGLTGSSFYLTMDAKQIDMEMMKVFSKKQTRFDGTITITDTFGKNAQRVIKFKQASLYNYSDQFSAASYGDTYGSVMLSIVCKEISINGIEIEQ